MDRYPHEIEEWDPDAPGTLGRTGRTGIGARFATSFPGAVAGAFLIGALAFGAVLQQTSAPGDGDAPPSPAQAGVEADGSAAPIAVGHGGGYDWDHKNDGAKGEPGTEPVKNPEPEPTKDVDATKEPVEKATPKPESKATPKPESKATPKPTVKPDSSTLGLSLATKSGKVHIDFTSCTVKGAEYYKVVRSTDSTVTWPTGKNDTGIAAVAIGSKTEAWDGSAPAGKKVWYRVFCVRHTDSGYKVLAASAAKSITAPSAPATPKPSTMWIAASASGGTVTVSWEKSGTDGFKGYKLVRKADDGSKQYFEFSDPHATSLVDTDVQSGRTYHYQVTAFAWWNGQKVVAGASDWTSVSVE